MDDVEPARHLYAVVLTTSFVSLLGSVRLLADKGSGHGPPPSPCWLSVLPTLAHSQLHRGCSAPPARLDSDWSRPSVETAHRTGRADGGGLVGAIFNLVALVVIGVAAEQVWGAKRWTVSTLAAGIGAQFWGKIVQPVGAGNSVVVFGLAASVAVLAVRQGVRVNGWSA
jgi:hypothetical protein